MALESGLAVGPSVVSRPPEASAPLGACTLGRSLTPEVLSRPEGRTRDDPVDEREPYPQPLHPAPEVGVTPDPGLPCLRVVSQKPEVPALEDGRVEDLPCGRRRAADAKPLARRPLEQPCAVDELGAGFPRDGNKGLEMVGLPDVVVVQEGDPVSASQIETAISGLRSCNHPTEERILGVPSPFCQVLEPEAGVAEGENAVLGVIGAGVPDDDDLGPTIGLGESRRQSSAGEKRAAVERRNDDRDKRLRFLGAEASPQAANVEPEGVQSPT